MENADIQHVPAEKEKGPIEGNPIRCGKCGTRNYGGRRCTQCGSRLHIACKRCGHRNLRSANHCSNCQQRLHHTLWRRWRHRLGRNRRFKFSLLQLLLVAALAYMAYKIIIRLANYEPPQVE